MRTGENTNSHEQCSSEHRRTNALPSQHAPAGVVVWATDDELAELVREANLGHGAWGVSGPESVRRFAELVLAKYAER